MILSIERIDEKLQSIKKPAIKKIRNIHVNKDDILILAAGFEDRALEIFKRISYPVQSGFTAIIIEYLPYIKENKSKEISNFLEQHGCHIHRITYNRQEPAGIGKQIIDAIADAKGKILVDISAMSRLLIVQIMVELGESHMFNRSSILYSEAKFYPPFKKEVEKKLEEHEGDPFYRQLFLSAGIFEVCIVPELSSIVLQGRPIRLVTFPSFNADQLANLQGEIQPYYINLIHGVPPKAENAWRTEAIKNLNKIDSIIRREDKDVCTLDYRETLDFLLEVYSNHCVMERIVIAPIGSKMQTVAVGIFRSFMNDVQIVYPTPKKFPSPHNYTRGVKDIYNLALDAFNI